MICVSYKSGAYKYDWTKSEEYRQKSIGKMDPYRPYLNFRFIDDFIVDGILDKDKAEKMLRLYEGMYFKQQDVETEHLRKLQYDWIICTDEEVEESIEIVLKALRDNKYNITSYSSIIGMLLILEDIGFDSNYTKNAVSLMKENIQKLKYNVMIDTGYSLKSDTDIGKKHKMIISELQKEVDTHYKSHTATRIGEFVSTRDDWAGNMFNYLKDVEIEIRNKTGLLYQINIDNLVGVIAGSTSKDIELFRRCIHLIYKAGAINEVLKKDESSLVRLLKGIKQLDNSSFDKIKTVQINYLIKNLEAVITLVDSEGDEV